MQSPGDFLDEITIASGLLLIVWSAALFRATRRWRSKCVTTEGRIVGFTESYDSDGSSTMYFDKIHFTDLKGQAVEIGGPHGRPHPPELGESLSITYDPTYPKNAFITGSFSPWVIPALILTAGVVALAVGAAIHFGFID
ncbi:MAG: DUF3592 domain-containing protein [Thermoanaerobaculia bacterium]